MTDTADNPLSSLEVALYPGGDREFQIKQFCATGKALKCATSANFDVWARLAGSGDSFTSLEGAGLDLSPWNGTTQTFEIKLEAIGAGEADEQIIIRPA